MVWNYDESYMRVSKHLDDMGEIEIKPYVKEMDLDSLSETRCRDIFGAHVYAEFVMLARSPIATYTLVASGRTSSPRGFGSVSGQYDTLRSIVERVIGVERSGGIGRIRAGQSRASLEFSSRAAAGAQLTLRRAQSVTGRHRPAGATTCDSKVARFDVRGRARTRRIRAEQSAERAESTISRRRGMQPGPASAQHRSRRSR